MVSCGSRAVASDKAERLKELLTGLPVDVRPLPAPQLEENTDAWYEHMDAVISELRERGFDANAIVVDFTRGTKAMSAALVLAAMRNDLQTPRAWLVTNEEW